MSNLFELCPKKFNCFFIIHLTLIFIFELLYTINCFGSLHLSLLTNPKSILSISKLINLDGDIYSQNNSLYKPIFSFVSVLRLKKSAFILVFSVIDLIEEFYLFNLLIY